MREEKIRALEKRPEMEIPIENVRIAYRGKNKLMPCGADPVTRKAQEMFETLGMRDAVENVAEYLQQDLEMANEEQVDIEEFALIEKNPTAYLLRRNFATHMAIVQLDEEQLAYVLGHVIEDPQIQRSDFTNEKLLFAIKCKMDKRPIVNNIGMPTVQIEAALNKTIKLSNYSQDVVFDSNVGRVKVRAVAKEPGDAIKVTIHQARGTEIKEFVEQYGDPYPQHFGRTVDVMNVYHKAFGNL